MSRRLAVRIVVLALVTGLLYAIAGPGHAPGLNVPLLVAWVVLAAHVVAGTEGLRRLDPADAWLGPGAIVLAVFVAIRAEPWLVAADIVLAGGLAAASVAALGGARVTRDTVPAAVVTGAHLVRAALVGAVPPLRRLRPTGAWSTAGRPSPHLVAIGRGVVIAVPVLVVLGVLFSAADAVFAAVLERVLRFELPVDLATFARTGADVAIAGWIAAGLLALAALGLPAASAATPEPAPGRAIAGWYPPGPVTPIPRRLVGPTEAATALLLVDLLVAVFVAIQAAYLFGGRDTLSVTGLTYAEYARRGFFELVAAGAVVIAVVGGLDRMLPRRSRPVLAASLVLVALTGLVLVSALERLRLYQAAYGWTELRLVVLAAIGWLAVALVTTAVLVASRRTRWLVHSLGILVLAGVVALNVAGPQAFVAERNLERALDPSLVAPGGRTGLDAAYLAGLGDGAVPVVLAALDRLDAADRAALRGWLDARSTALATDPSLAGWPSWNLARERARAALSAGR